MEVQDDVAGSMAGIVWRGHSCPRTVCSEMALQTTDFVCALGRREFTPHIGCGTEI
jgi:hypothetical protein